MVVYLHHIKYDSKSKGEKILMKLKFIIFILFYLLFLKGNLLSQTIPTDTAVEVSCQFYLDTALKKQVYLFADQKAEFPGGEKAMYQFLATHVKFPDGFLGVVNGTVFIEFVVSENGSIIRKAIRRSVQKSLDEEALRVIDQFPKFIPAKCDGKTVPFLIMIPIKFIMK